MFQPVVAASTFLLGVGDVQDPDVSRILIWTLVTMRFEVTNVPDGSVSGRLRQGIAAAAGVRAAAGPSATRSATLWCSTRVCRLDDVDMKYLDFGQIDIAKV